MSSNKRKDPIQKSVEESILDAVTKLQKNEPSFDPFDGVNSPKKRVDDKKPLTPEDVWKIANSAKTEQDAASDKAGAPAKNAEVPVTQKPGFGLSQILPTFGNKKEAVNAPPLPPERPRAFAPGAAVPGSEFSAQNLANLNSVQLKLYEGDHLKIAQQRISDLERELEKLRLENERLGSATELFQKRNEENLRAKQEIEKKYQFNEERFSEERVTLKAHLEQRDQLIKDLKDKVEELENRLTTDVRKSRSRERELENRLELARLERLSLVGSKDEIILDLKRQIDQLNHELGNYRRKNADMNQTLEANQDQFRRTVRALRLALTNLEVNEQSGGRSKKAE